MSYYPKSCMTLLLIIVLLSSCNWISNRSAFPIIEINYPPNPRDTSYVSRYFNTDIKDPYHWMESTNNESTRNWIQNQRILQNNYLTEVSYKAEIKNRLIDLWEYEQFSLPIFLGDGLAQFISTDFTQHPILFEVNEYGETGKILFDPNQSLNFGNSYFVKWSFSKGGRFAAALTQEFGAPWQTIVIIDLSNAQVLDEEIIGVKNPTISWYKSGFFYTKFDEVETNSSSIAPDYFHQVLYHNLGDRVSNDEIIYADRSQPTQLITPYVTADDSYLVLKLDNARGGTLLRAKPLGRRNAYFTDLMDCGTADCDFIGKENNDLFVYTNQAAPNGQVVSINRRKIGKNEWNVFLPETDQILERILITKGYFVGLYYDGGAQNINVFNRKKELLHTIELPAPGTVEDINLDINTNTGFFSFSSVLQSPRIYSLTVGSGAMEIFKSSITDFDSNQFQVRRVNFPSFDGELIQMYLIHRKGLDLNPNVPTLLIGTSAEERFPRYNMTGLQLIPAFLDGNGCVAIPVTRGMQRMNSYWERSGILDKRQKAFDDFQAAASFLIEQGLTSSEKLAAYGQGATGGLLVTACLTQRPDLFKVVVGREGVYDLLRYQYFSTGWRYADQIGWSSAKADFDPLWAIDPRRNAISTTYPAVMLTASLSNLEIAPIHAYKLVAELQARQLGQLPILLKLDNSAVGVTLYPATSSVNLGTDILTFMCYQLGFNPIAPQEPNS